MKATDRPFLPYGRQLIEEEEIDAVTSVLRSDYLTTGPIVEAFEEKLASTTGALHAISTSSGTAALHISALAIGLKPGDIAIAPSMTFLSTVNAALYAGADVVFADVDPDTGLMTSEGLEKALHSAGERARALFVVHLNGQTANMAGLAQVPTFDRLNVIEDACHALGGMHSDLDGKMVAVGSNAFAQMSIFSFHPVKTVAMGEGGAITTNDIKLATRLRTLRNIGMTHDPASFQSRDQAFDSHGSANPWYYEMAILGLNYRASAIHCAIGMTQLGKLRRFVDKRSALVRRYRERLAKLAPLIRPLPEVTWCKPAWHLFVVLIDFAAFGCKRADVMRVLYERGIGTQVHYIPVHRQPYYRERYGDLDLPGTDAYYEKVLSLPLFVSMTNDDVDFVVSELCSVLGEVK
ncbi:MAG: UDP-4-amino-4,6-dideoxy-N-acetyl-beta-L-altrosamine transaminase [Magnetovibrio sp.]|nr:UDP-4-amino-4,6-dideoxy-N-acetyl-beta-L-altrosamine transaminase [Magnetovibrio sp.]